SFDSELLSIFLIMPLILIIIALTESGRPGGVFPFHIQMRSIPIGTHTKTCNSLPSLFCDNRCDRSGRGTKTVPQNHWRNSQQMGNQDTAKPEMAEKYQRIFICFFHPITMIFSHIPMFRQQSVKILRHPVILLLHGYTGKSFRLKPVIVLIKFLLLSPASRQPVPGNSLLTKFIEISIRSKFPQPFTFHGCTPHLFQCKRCRVLRSSHGRYIEIFYIQLLQSRSEERRVGKECRSRVSACQ